MTVVHVIIIIQPIVPEARLDEEEIIIPGLYAFSFLDTEAVLRGETATDNDAIEKHARDLLANWVRMKHPDHFEITAWRLDDASHIPVRANTWESDLAGFERLAQAKAERRLSAAAPMEHRSAA